MNVLVVGGAGYIGSHICKNLAANGWKPVVYDNLSRGDRRFVLWGPLVEGDIRDRGKLQETILKYRPVATIHLAAFAYVGESNEDPRIYYNNNVVGSLTLIDALSANGNLPMVFSSSCTVYGNQSNLPLTESHPVAPINPYGNSKLTVENILADYRRAYGFPSTTLRYFNAVGADPDMETGESHNPEPHLIPIILEVAYGDKPHLTVFGNDYPTPDGSCVRDYIHVSDIARAHVLVLEELLKDNAKPLYNLGTGVGYSVLEIVRAVEKVAKVQVPVEFAPRRAGDPATLYADASLIQDHLGWKPEYMELEYIIDTAWRWFKKERIGS
ncbi:MAG: UDP-glucose 4-epimerase GalE [Magnetococcales bacterium]|nr:UDP-glucose 4-epimerase GalE [Magnetococcales bacterium]